jgi:hypothetical protein
MSATSCLKAKAVPSSTETTSGRSADPAGARFELREGLVLGVEGRTRGGARHESTVSHLRSLGISRLSVRETPAPLGLGLLLPATRRLLQDSSMATPSR